MTDLWAWWPGTPGPGQGTPSGPGGGPTGPATDGPATSGPATSGPTSGPSSGAPATGPSTPAVSGPGVPVTPARQNTSWTQDGADNMTADRGVQDFQPAASGTQETLTLRGTGATARVGDSAANLQAATLTGNNLLIDVPAGATKFVEITWPSQAAVDDAYHLFFTFDRPETNAMLTGYSAGSPSPTDSVFLTRSQAKSATAAGGFAGLEAWLRSRSGNTLHINAYASYENDPADFQHNQELSQRRMEVAQQAIEHFVPGRFNSADRHFFGHSAAAQNTVPTITPGGGAPDGHGPTSHPEHRVAIITGPTQKHSRACSADT